MVREVTLVTAKERLAKKPMGSMGSLARRSQATKAASRATPMMRQASTVLLVQPSV
jgi:hypothetical protein